MDLYEYQAKELLREANITTPREINCTTVDDAQTTSAQIGLPVVIKAQVKCGGRGKAGGIKVAHTTDEVKLYADEILNMQIKGFPVKSILISECVTIEKELYLSITIDRKLKSLIFILSREGGVEIEEIHKKSPELIIKQKIDTFLETPHFVAKEMARELSNNYDITIQIEEIIIQLYKALKKFDATLIEINPLVITDKGVVSALDAKISIDNNALYRQQELIKYRDPSESEIIELEAKEHGLSYVKLDGNIGCIVNGAGLAMATMDMIELYGGSPANFLDIGGSSNPNKVYWAMKYLTDSPNVKAIMINIFGGITRCDDVAAGLIKAFKKIDIKIPVTIRLAGTNSEEGIEMLKEQGLSTVSTMSEAAEKTLAKV